MKLLSYETFTKIITILFKLCVILTIFIEEKLVQLVSMLFKCQGISHKDPIGYISRGETLAKIIIKVPARLVAFKCYKPV